MIDIKELAQKLKPFFLNMVGANSSANGTVAFTPASYPDALLRDGSRSLNGHLAVGPGITIDGVDISQFAADTAAWQIGHVSAANPHPVYVLKTTTLTPAFGVLLDGGSAALDLSTNRTFAADYTTIGLPNKLVATNSLGDIITSGGQMKAVNFVANSAVPHIAFVDTTDSTTRVLYGDANKFRFTSFVAGSGSASLTPTAPETGLLTDFNGADTSSLPGLTYPVFNGGNPFGRVSNRGQQSVFSAGAGNSSNTWTGGSANDFEMYLTIVTPGVAYSYLSLWGRVTGANSGPGNPSLNMVRGLINWDGVGTASWRIQQVINGDDSNGYIATVNSVAANAGDKFWLRCVGTTVKIWRQASGSGTWTLLATATTSITGSGGYGFGVSGGAPNHAVIDDLGGGALVGSGASTLTPLIDLLDNGTLTTPTFASGFAGSGWRIDNGEAYAGTRTAEFDNLIVRGLMRVYELIINKIRVSRGSLIVSPGGGKVSAVSGSGPYTITFDDDHGLVVNDLLRAQKFTGSGTYVSRLTVTAVPTSTTATVTLFSGSAPAVGYEYAVIGNTSNTSRQGLIYLSADDSGAPLLDVVDGIAAHGDWGSFAKTKARLGKLSGITDGYWGALSGYGLYSNNIYLTGAIRAMSGRIDGVLDIGTSGEIRQGTGVWGTNFTGTRMFNTSGVGRWATYNNDIAQAYVDTDGTVKAGAGNVVLDASGIRIVGADGGTPANPNQIRFVNSSGVVAAYLSSYNLSTGSFVKLVSDLGSGAGDMQIITTGYSTNTENSNLTLAAQDKRGSPTKTAAIALFGSSETIVVTAAGGMDANGIISTNQYFKASQHTPASNATGATGQVTWDTNYIYICTATNTWKRVALSTY